MKSGTSIQNKMVNGVAWMVAARLLDRSIGIISTLVLARLLVPDDFGLVAMATAIGGALDLLGAFSFDLALIQKANGNRRHYDTVWTFNVLFGCFCGLVLILLAGAAANFYRDERLEAVIYVLSFGYIIGGFANVGVVNFRKHLQFKREFTFILLKRIITFVFTVAAAIWLRSYWALLIGMTVGRFANVIISYRMSEYRPALTLSAANELFHFSKWLFLNNTLFFLLHNGCTFIVARTFGATGVGIFSIAYEVSNLPSTELVAPINRATFPAFSKMADAYTIRKSYLQLLSMITLVILPIGIGIAAVAEPLVLLLLGEQWANSIPLIKVLALHGAITATQTNNGPVWMALGRPSQLTLIAAVFLVVLFPALFYFIDTYGLVGIGYAYLLAHVPAVPLSMRISKRLLGFRWLDLFSAVWRPMIAATAMYLGVLELDNHVRNFGPALRLIIDCCFGAFVYSLVILSLWFLSGRASGAESFLLSRARSLCTPSPT